MTLKIERFWARLRLSGELRSEHLAQVRTELRKCGKWAVLDLEEVNLADVEGVRFLNRCEAKGISVLHCSPYIREWMLRERAERKRPEAEEGEQKMKSAENKASIVFCHGIWADGSCFNKVIPTLQADGHEVISAQYGLNKHADDVATVKRTLGRVSSPAILVGHSYGGSVITAAGMDDRVAALVYIAALAPDANETSQSQVNKFPVSEVVSHIEVADGRIWLKPEGVRSFAGDLPEAEQKIVWATHYAPDADLFNQKVEGTAWKSKPNWYIVATQDRTVRPELQRFVSKRMGAKATEVASSHVPMLSQPKLVIDVIRTAAQAIGARSTAA